MFIRPALGLTILLACAPLAALADSAASECDRLAGYAEAPRLAGNPGPIQVYDPDLAISACRVALEEIPGDPHLQLQLGRAYLARDRSDPEAGRLFEGLRESLPAIARLRLGSLSYYGDGGLPEDRAAAQALYEEACAMSGQPGAATACSNLALMLADGDNEAEHARGVALLETACAEGEMGACVNLGVEFEYGEAVPQDLDRAMALYRQACDGGEPLGCNNLANGMVEGTAPGGMAEANALFRQACVNGEARGCSDLGVSYGDGAGLDADPGIAAALYQMACEGGNATGCANLGEAYRDGDGVPQDLARAMDYMGRACDEGEGWGCLMQVDLLHDRAGMNPATPLLASILSRACRLGENEACQRLNP